MGYASAIRFFDASIRRRARELERLRRHEARQMVIDEKQGAMQLELETARREVEMFKERIEQLTKLGRECGERINWFEESQKPEPATPNDHEDAVSRQEFQSRWQEWEQQTRLARSVLSGDLHVYAEVLQELSPFESLAEVGSQFSFAFEDQYTCSVEVDVLDPRIVPEEVKSLTPTGKLTTRSMALTRKWEIYQDYVCGAIFRAVRELFSLLPFRFVVSSAYCEQLNLSNGLNERVCIASVAARRETVHDLDFEHVDFSAAMSQFPHRMRFKKKSGFESVVPFTTEGFDLSDLAPKEMPM